MSQIKKLLSRIAKIGIPKTEIYKAMPVTRQAILSRRGTTDDLLPPLKARLLRIIAELSAVICDIDAAQKINKK